jgi:ornithine carbamoyltransferase
MLIGRGEPRVAKLELARVRSRQGRAKDFLSILDLDHDELESVLEPAEMKRERRGPFGARPLAGMHVALLFESRPFVRGRRR